MQNALGILARPSALHYLGTYLYDITILLIFVGFISLIFQVRKGKFNLNFFLVQSISIGLLVSAVVVPLFAGLLELGRLYQTLLMFLAPLFVQGVEGFLLTFSNLRQKLLNQGVK